MQVLDARVTGNGFDRVNARVGDGFEAVDARFVVVEEDLTVVQTRTRVDDIAGQVRDGSTGKM
jgi:hypothetical protein